MTDRELLLDIHQKLCKVCSYIDKIQTPEYIKAMEDRDFSINVAADLYVEQLEKFFGKTYSKCTMIYWIENAKDGFFVASAGTYEKALIIQDKKWREEGIDTYIRKE